MMEGERIHVKVAMKSKAAVGCSKLASKADFGRFGTSPCHKQAIKLHWWRIGNLGSQRQLESQTPATTFDWL